jgi:hypothetical protein
VPSELNKYGTDNELQRSDNSIFCVAHLGFGKDQTNIPERKRIFTPRNLALNIDKPDVIYQFNICN